jgi:hypothetical protein
LKGAEARLFAETLLRLLDEAQTDHLADYSLGVWCFDDLTAGQKMGVLATVAKGLLKPDVPTVKLTAVLEGAIAAIFEELRNMVAFEVDEPDFGTFWRELIVAAREEMGGEEIPAPNCDDPEEWDIEIQEVSDCILWDADYESGGLYLDRAPEESQAHREMAGIDQDYYLAIADDLEDEQIQDALRETRGLCCSVLGEQPEA